VELSATIKNLFRTLIEGINAYSELKRVRKELEQVRQEKESLRIRNLELAEETGKLKGELSAKTEVIGRLNRETEWKNDEILRLQQKITALTTNFEEKVRLEVARGLHLYSHELIREIKEDFISRYLFSGWTVTCNKCHSKFSITPTARQIEELMRVGQTHVQCLNRDCVDAFLFIQNPHGIPLRLEDFVKSVMDEKFAQTINKATQLPQ
jgi:chromosome segregation ATPase